MESRAFISFRSIALKPKTIASRRECSQRYLATAFNRSAYREMGSACPCVLTCTLDLGHAGPHKYLRRH